MHILVTRPETEAARTTRQLEAMGHRVTSAPLLDVVVQSPPLDLSNVQAVIFTSRNAVNALQSHPQKGDIRRLPALAVGKSTAAAAYSAGFHVALQGDAGGAELARLIVAQQNPEAGALLHLSGEAVAFDLEAALQPHGFAVRQQVVYRTEPTASLPSPVAAALRRGDLDAVLLMSPRTAASWCALVSAAGLAEKARQLMYLCLSSGVAEAARSLAPVRIEVAAKPTEEEMLALAARLSSSSTGSP
jgi:uroporphyrinogen-III synthase